MNSAGPPFPDIARRRCGAQGISPPRDRSPEAVVTRLGAIQAQDYPGALWSIALRMPAATRADVEHAIAERRIIRTWPMRGTLHFVPAVDARWMLALLTPRIIRSSLTRHRALGLDDAVLGRSRTLITKALSREPVITRSAIFALLEKQGIGTTGTRGSNIVQRLCMDCVLSFGPHSDRQPTFALFDAWVRTHRTLDRDEALRTIAERFFTGHGPASLRDFVWWTGLTVADAKRAVHLAAYALESFTSNDVAYWMGADAPMNDTPGRAHLLPGFDELLLGYKDRSASLDDRHASLVVPGSNGVFKPTLVLDGRVIGTWRRTSRAGRTTIEATPFTRLKAAERALFAAPAARFAEFVGEATSITWADRAVRSGVVGP